MIVLTHDDLVNGVFYWLRFGGEITIGQWDSDYGIHGGCFWVCGSDEPVKIPRDLEFSDILFPCELGDWK